MSRLGVNIDIEDIWRTEFNHDMTIDHLYRLSITNYGLFDFYQNRPMEEVD